MLTQFFVSWFIIFLVGIICDGNRVNQAFFKMFDTSPDSPWKTKDDKFLLFDFVHLLKCIRNNWITEKTQELSFKISDHTYTAKWSDTKTLHLLEKQKLVKLSKLSDISVAPRPIERQKVSTCLEVFCDETISALKTHPDLLSRDVAGTTKFIQTFVNFWKVVNVHSPLESVKLHDSRRSVITSLSDEKLDFLESVGELAKGVTPPTAAGPRVKSLTKDTSANLAHLCFGLVDLTRFLLKFNHDFVALGNFTTDPLEKQFSKLRQGSGGAYFISVQQALEKNEINKTKVFLKLNPQLLNDVAQTLPSGHSCAKCSFLLPDNLCDLVTNLPALENSLCEGTKMVLVYVAGYVVRHHDVGDNTYLIFAQFGSYLRDLNRGKLQIPGDSTCQWAFFCYIMFHEVVNFTCRSSLCKIFQLISDYFRVSVTPDQCFILSNIFFNNYCSLCSPRFNREPKQKVLKLSR